MGQLHYCDNGNTVTDQVILYKSLREKNKTDESNEAYKQIHNYYGDYKKLWHKQVEDYIDRKTFNLEFDFKLLRAVDSFDIDQAKSLASTNGWSYIGMFNRWFYAILQNWKSNVKTSSYRLKKRPSVTCPVCGEDVARIDEEHLKHIMTTRHLPSFFEFDGAIYETKTTPSDTAVTYGKYSKSKMNKLIKDKKLLVEERAIIAWPWADASGKRMVICPITKKAVEAISDDYLYELPADKNRYAESVPWHKFCEEYPNSLIESREYCLDLSHSEDCPLKDRVGRDRKLPGKSHVDQESSLDQIRSNKVSVKYSDVFTSIDSLIPDEIDKDILKLIAVGYSVEDIADTINVKKSEVKKRMKNIRENAKKLEKKLIDMA